MISSIKRQAYVLLQAHSCQLKMLFIPEMSKIADSSSHHGIVKSEKIMLQ